MKKIHPKDINFKLLQSCIEGIASVLEPFTNDNDDLTNNILNKLFKKELKKILPERRILFLRELKKQIKEHKKKV